MKVGIDISMLVYNGSGVATYTYNLVQSLLLHHPEHSYHLFYSSLRRPKLFHFLKEFKKNGAHIHSYRMPPRVLAFLWNKYSFLPVEWLIGKVDVYHSSDFLRPPLSMDTIGITTIHDLTWKIFPEYHTEEIVMSHNRKLEMTVENNDIIITDSNNSKIDLLHCYPKIKNQISVIPLGIDEHYKILPKNEKFKAVLKKYNLSSSTRYLLYVGAIEPRKNVDRSIKVFSELLQHPEYKDFQFVIVGRAGWKNEHVYKLVSDLKLEKKVHFVGFVPLEELPYLYNGAQVFMYLSSYEGFGLPPLEAAKCRTPTLLYNNSSLKEIMPQNYLFAKEGQEIETLIKLLRIGSKAIEKVTIPTWKTYADTFIELIEKNVVRAT